MTTPNSVGARPPNVLFLISDEHSAHALHCDGNPLVKTPTLDALAATGTLFTSAYCQNPVCVPSRASFVTGKMPSRVGVFANKRGRFDERATLATVFRRAGYRAEWLGKEHWGGEPGFGAANEAATAESERRCERAVRFRKSIGRLPQNAAVADHLVEEKLDSVTTDHALRFLDQAGQEPFFLGVSYRNPHFPFGIQQRFYDLYKEIVDAPTVTKAMLDALPELLQRERTKFDFATLSTEQVKKARAMYFGMVSYIDEEVAKILAKLEERGLRDDTIVLYVSDHGEMAGEHGLWYKNTYFEASVSVPFIWSFPQRLPVDQRVDAHVMNVDIFPTLCELAGIAQPPDLQGKSLLPLMTGSEDGSDRIAVSENHRRRVSSRMIRADRWKCAWYANGDAQLFDLDADPGETRNLAGDRDYAGVMADLRRRSDAAPS